MLRWRTSVTCTTNRLRMTEIDDRERQGLDDLEHRPPREGRLGLALHQWIVLVPRIVRRVCLLDRHRIKCGTLRSRWM